MSASNSAHVDDAQGTSSPPLADTLDLGLVELFGFETFRPGQRDVMDAALDGVNALVVMPTGSGKSLCYQLPACVLDGVTLVISPLIALMKDQVDALQAKGISATFINSSISTSEQRDRLFAMEQGHYKIVYIAPERFRNQAFCDAIANTKVALLAIDEAHCISQWGHDFRPDYLRMAEIREQLDHPPTLALTATATSQVQRDILQQLNLPEAEIFVYGFERPNLFFEIYDARTKGDKIDRMTALLDHYDGDAAIVYCATRKQVEEVARDLTDAGLIVGLYHGGLSDAERERVQNDFMDGVFPVLVATNAFGMGVDKSDIRVIIHYNIPGSIEAYYQEAGRAGRDGKPSHCLMLFNFNDRGIHEFFNEQTYPRRNTIERVWDEVSHLGTGTHPMGPEQVTDRVNRSRDRRDKKVNSWGVESSMRQLQRAGHLEFGVRDGFPWTTVFSQSRRRDLLVDWEYLDRRRDVNEGLLEDVVRLTSGRTCRQLYLLRYFNSKPSFAKGCGNCDICCEMPEYARNAMLANTRKTLIPEERTTLMQKILSGVARARGRCGAHLVAQSLRGSKAKKVKQFGLDRLSTYGVVSYLKQPDIVSLLDQFLRHDLIKRNEHGAISLTDFGNTVMRNPEEVPADLAMWLESAFVERRGAVRRQPKPAAPRPSGEGATHPPAGGAARAPVPQSDDTYMVTLEMFEGGHDFVQIASARDVKVQTVLRHLMVLADRGETFDLSAHIKDELLERVRAAAEGWTYGQALAPVKEAAGYCTYDDLKIHLAQVLMERHASQ